MNVNVDVEKLLGQPAIVKFVAESYELEDNKKPFSLKDLDNHITLWNKSTITVQDCVDFMMDLDPEAYLRSERDIKAGQDYPYAPYGGPELVEDLALVLKATVTHRVSAMETVPNILTLQPFTRYNGVLARALWMWSKLHWENHPEHSFLKQWYLESAEYIAEQH